MFQGLSGPGIAFNEYHIAPSATASAKRTGAADEHARNKRAAKCARRKRKPYAGPPQPTAAPRRERYVLRALARDIRKAMARGDTATFARLAHKFEILMALRSKRLELEQS